MRVLSLQSCVVAGHVGNAAAVFCLQRLGVEAWPVDTLTFSNHPGHGGFRGRVTPAGEITALVDGLNDRGWLGQVDAVLSGYLGDPAQGPAVLGAVNAVRAANPRAIWLLDPVMGDQKPGEAPRLFVKPGLPEFFRSAAAQADILAPNAFELSQLTGRAIDGLPAALAAARAIGPRLVLVKSLRERPGHLSTLAVEPDRAWRIETPELPTPANGAGDVFAAVFLARYLAGRDCAAALAHALGAVHGLVAAAATAGSADLPLIALQELVAAPRDAFTPRAV